MKEINEFQLLHDQQQRRTILNIEKKRQFSRFPISVEIIRSDEAVDVIVVTVSSLKYYRMPFLHLNAVIYLLPWKEWNLKKIPTESEKNKSNFRVLRVPKVEPC